MAKLTTARRKKLPKSKFALPEKRAYPIDTRNRAVSALSRVAQHGTPTQKKRVRAAVRSKYPSLPSSKHK